MTLKATCPVKAVGGKRRILANIQKLMPATFNTYYEPFFGGGAVFFGFDVLPQRCVINDTNAELINFYQVLRTSPEALIELTRTYKYEEIFYYSIRERQPAVLTNLERAARMLYLNKTCFNGLFRVNKKGQFNVPFGKFTNPTIVDADNLRACAERLAGVDIRCVDFEDVIDEAKKGDLCYVDSPYTPVSATANFTAYSADGFQLKDHERLAACLRRAKDRGVHVIASNADVPLVRKLYEGFTLETVMVGRTISSKATKRDKVAEVLIT